MITLGLGVRNKYATDFKEFCQENGAEITYARDISKYTHIEVSCDSSIVDKISQFNDKLNEEHRAKLNWFMKLVDSITNPFN